MENNVEQPLLAVNNKVPHPWRRNFARGLDVSLYGLIVSSFFMLIIRWNASSEVTYRFVDIILSSVLMLFIEPLLLSLFGTTPGKWVFGLVLRDRNGDYLTYANAFERTFLVLFKGYGFHIPIYNLYRTIKSFGQCSDNEEMEWDRGLSYSIKDTKGLRIIGLFAGWILVFLISLVIVVQAKLPVNRGNISLEEYYENCNDFIDYNNISHGYKINNQGDWVNSSSGNTIYVFDSKPLKHQVLFDGDDINMIIIEVELENSDDWLNYVPDALMAYTSFVGADRSLNGFNFAKGVEEYFNDFYRNFEFEKDDYKISNTVKYSGYSGGNSYLIPDQDSETSFYMRFTIEKTRN